MKRKPKFSGFSWSTLKALLQYTLLSNPETRIHFVIPQHHRALVKAGELTLSYYLNCQLVKKKIRQNDKLKGTICNSLKGYFNFIYSHIFFSFLWGHFFYFTDEEKLDIISGALQVAMNVLHLGKLALLSWISHERTVSRLEVTH